MQWLWRTMVSIGLALGLSLMASVSAIGHAAALNPYAGASDQGQLRPDVVSPARDRARSTVRTQTGDSPRENDDRGSSPVFAFVCALIGFAVIVYLVVRRLRSTEPAPTQV